MNETEQGALLILALVAGGGVIYFVPTVVAGTRKHPQGGAIFALNLLLGWTFLGWVAALVWACTATAPAKPAAAVQEERRPCPECGESIMRTAKVCRFCRADLAGRAAA